LAYLIDKLFQLRNNNYSFEDIVMTALAARKKQTPTVTAKKGTLKKTAGLVPFIFLDLYHMDSMEQINFIKAGISSDYVLDLSDSMEITKDYLFKILNFPKSTIDRKILGHQPLSTEQGERLVGLAKLVEQAKSMVVESGHQEGFKASKWVAQWIDQPCPALGGNKPSTFMDTMAGQALVSKILAQMQTGAYG